MTKDHVARHRSGAVFPLLHQPRLSSTPHQSPAPPQSYWSHFCLLLLLLAVPACSSKQSVHPDDASIRAFLTRYFSTWSAKDMDGYASCFHPQARVLFLMESGQVASEGLTDFLHGQRLAHETAAVPMSERPLNMTIQGDAKIAQASVTWVLTKGSIEERGTDFFTLKREGDGWKIVTLVFYGE